MIFRSLLAFLCLSASLVFSCQAAFRIPSSPSLASLESLPVQDQGRKKPFLVFADEFLLALSGASSLTLEQTSFTAIQVTTALWLIPSGWEHLPVLLVKDKSLKKASGLPENQDLFSFATLRDNPRLQLQILEARDARGRNPETRLSGTIKAADDVASRMLLLAALAEGSLVRIVPNAAGSQAVWSALPAHDPRLAHLRTAYATGNTAAFSAALTALKTALSESAPAYYAAGMSKIRLELLYQAVHPFRWAWILYLLSGLSLLFLPSRPRDLAYPCAWVFAATGLFFQITGFVCRILIAGRPPVTNMYESMIWVAFGTVLFALIFESIYRARFFLAGAIPVAAASLILADSQPLILSSSLHPLTAVLQSNFWLTIHVLTITLSYAAFALAMGVAHIALGKTVFGRPPHPLLYNYIYRVLQVGVLLLACGTILGGVWANYSWGRFWNWDPKETWALITLLAYLIVLHGRIAGKWNGFGLAVGAVVGFLSVLMAWYGVNFVLGTGLHSYGFGTGGFQYVIAVVVLDMAFVSFAVMKQRMMKNIKKPSASAPIQNSEIKSTNFLA